MVRLGMTQAGLIYRSGLLKGHEGVHIWRRSRCTASAEDKAYRPIVIAKYERRDLPKRERLFGELTDQRDCARGS
jgi:hypothetical protein